ncbi:hypothetical protein [Nocardioides sp. ChNu-99]|uniref:hypothetical protein n=1 Tax=Nocardioides sp. ChNu-99 TaxID=2839897 RepID=UPI00240548DB|nr:hypothetical protein [Nocardioides sp. ChNu-99]MDF9717880.1 hypothetical protein [Nocardioides sp. ChNu-99]
MRVGAFLVVVAIPVLASCGGGDEDVSLFATQEPSSHQEPTDDVPRLEYVAQLCEEEDVDGRLMYYKHSGKLQVDRVTGIDPTTPMHCVRNEFDFEGLGANSDFLNTGAGESGSWVECGLTFEWTNRAHPNRAM